MGEDSGAEDVDMIDAEPQVHCASLMQFLHSTSHNCFGGVPCQVAVLEHFPARLWTDMRQSDNAEGWQEGKRKGEGQQRQGRSKQGAGEAAG